MARGFQLALQDRLRRRDVQAVADRGVDAERHIQVEPVVDHRGDEWPLLWHLHLLLDHRGDGEDVVRGQVLRLRVLEVDLAPVAVEGLELVADELLRRRVLGEVVSRGEEKALEIRHVLREAGRRIRRLRDPQVLRSERLGVIGASSSAILFTGRDAVGHLDASEALGKTMRRHRASGGGPVVVSCVAGAEVRATVSADDRKRDRRRARRSRGSARRDRERALSLEDACRSGVLSREGALPIPGRSKAG
jgi:hypothetical protein